MPRLRRTHGVTVEGPHAWTWNGSLDSPTLSPSILVRSGHFADGNRVECWCTYEARYGKPAPFHCRRCHSFVRGGYIEFCNDSTHALAGQTVPLPDWEQAHD